MAVVGWIVWPLVWFVTMNTKMRAERVNRVASTRRIVRMRRSVEVLYWLIRFILHLDILCLRTFPFLYRKAMNMPRRPRKNP
jgi:hypothetical protein